MLLIYDKEKNIIARLIKKVDFNNEQVWLTENTDGIQVASINGHDGRIFRAHQHKYRPRTTNYTEEAIYIISGKLSATIRDDTKQIVLATTLLPGDLIITHRGYHEYKILQENTNFLEFKNGPFTNVEDDKTYLNP